MGPKEYLKNLRNVGFKTFSRWWDESYDNIKDPVARLGAVIDVIKDISSRDTRSLESMLKEMNDVLQYNDRFNAFDADKKKQGTWKFFYNDFTLLAAILFSSQQNAPVESAKFFSASSEIFHTMQRNPDIYYCPGFFATRSRIFSAIEQSCLLNENQL